MERIELYFGGSVHDDDWARFAATVLTPAFQDGFTAFDAAGQWRDPADGRIVRERTRVVQIFGAGLAGKASAVSAAYRARFHQVSVGEVSGPACAAF